MIGPISRAEVNAGKAWQIPTRARFVVAKDGTIIDVQRLTEENQ
jgi:hypothetical protein